jgi:branched-chain amino acid transport system permease protein
MEVFFVGGLIAGLTGVLLSELVAPSAYLGFNYTIKGFIAAAIGGLGSVRGALLGGFVIGLVEAYSGLVLGTQWQNPALLVVLVALLLISPTGLVRVRRARVRTV